MESDANKHANVELLVKYDSPSTFLGMSYSLGCNNSASETSIMFHTPMPKTHDRSVSDSDGKFCLSNTCCVTENSRPDCKGEIAKCESTVYFEPSEKGVDRESRYSLMYCNYLHDAYCHKSNILAEA